MTRLFWLTFHGPKRWTDDIKHPHESPKIMTIPLILLAVGSVAAGCLLPPRADWLTPVYGAEDAQHEPVIAALLITSLALVLTSPAPGWPSRCSARAPPWQEQPAGVLVTAARKQPLHRRLQRGGLEAPGRLPDPRAGLPRQPGIDGLVNGLAARRRRRLRPTAPAQTGFVRSYALSILGGAVLVVAATLAVRFG
jgi:NADH-quinone oxidoreductase subunit L